jgi:hypothetical protein
MAGLVFCLSPAQLKQVHRLYAGGSLRAQTERKGGLK